MMTTDGPGTPEILPLAAIEAEEWPDPEQAPVEPAPAPPPDGRHKKPKGIQKLKATNAPAADVVERAVAYMLKNTPAVSGDNGSKRTMWAARCVVYGFDLGPEVGYELLQRHHNPTCQPEWSERELRHKCADADKNDFNKPRGWLRDASAPTAQAQPPKGAPGSAERPLEILCLPELLARDFPEPRWAVPGLLSEGLTILAGKPKLGKSWLALNLGLTIAAGGMALGTTKVVAGDVLYLSLEDRWRRIQDRARKVLHGIGCAASARLHVAVEWPRQDQGGLAAIEKWIKRVERPTLVIVDVWAKFRPIVKGGNRNAYEQDYEQVSEFKRAMDDNRVSAAVVHHCKKAKSEDALEEVSGTNGIAGSADGILVLTRARSENEAELFMTGRDIEEAQLALEFDPKSFVWKSLGRANDRTDSKLKAALLDVFKSNLGTVLSANELALKLGITDDGKKHYMRTLLSRMDDAGDIERVRPGCYRCPVADPQGRRERGF